MTLKDYLDRSNLTYEGFAALIPCSITYPHMIAHGKARPGFKMACRIEAVTGGSVPRTNWYPSDSDMQESEEILNTELINETMKTIKP